MAARRTLVVIGIDGATFNVIDPLIERGELPNLAGLIREGTRGELHSTFPPLTHPAWSTFLTGKNPGKHGVFDAVTPAHEKFAGADYEFSNFNTVKAPTFWELLGHTQLKFGIVNLPMTYPPRALNGFLIAGIDTPDENSPFTFPDSLSGELKSQGIRYRPDFSGRQQIKSGRARYRDLREVCSEFFEIETERRKAIAYLMDNKPWDVFVVVLSVTDRIGHRFWQHHDPLPGEENNPFKNALEDSYRFSDEIVGDLLGRIDRDVPVMVVSDHGFGRIEKTFFINAWLQKHGFLSTHRITWSSFWKHYRLKITRRPLVRLLRAVGLPLLAKLLPGRLAGVRVPLLAPARITPSTLVDWDHTLAYGGAFGIYVNLKGRTPSGIVEPGAQYQKVRDRIIEALESSIDPDTNAPFVARVVKKEEMYSGEFADEGPDLFVIGKGQEYLPDPRYNYRRVFEKRRSGSHRMEGILILRGKPFQPGRVITGAHIEDCLPTMLHLLGEAIPTDLDGKVLAEAFTEEYLESHAPRYRDPLPFDWRAKAGKGSDTYSEDEEKMIHERLRSLGYIE